MSSAFERFATLDAPKFVDPTLMGVAALYTRAGYAPASVATINVNFLSPEEAQALGEASVIDTHPHAIIVATDVPNAGHGDKLVIAGVTYYILSVRNDGAGHLIATLTEDLEVPFPLFDLATVYAGGLTFGITWSVPVDEHRSAIEVWMEAAEEDVPFQRLATVIWTDTSNVIELGTPGIYTFRVRGINPAGPGPWSNTLTVEVVE